MGMVVQHNMQASNANRMLGITTSAQAKSTEKLSSGYRINRAADDAAGLTISEKMRKQIRGLDKASSNAQDGVSSVQTAEGALTEVHSMLQRMNELATQAANGTNSQDTDRKAIQDEIDQLTTEIDRVAETTRFNETYLLKGDADGTTKTTKLSAHDAGLAGKLVDNGDTAMFTAKALTQGGKVNIAGEEYTVDGITAPTSSAITHTAGTVGTKATEQLVLAGMKSELDGKATFKIDGTDYTIDVEKDDDADKIGAKLATALNGKIDDGVGGNYTVTNNAGTLTFEASANGAAGRSLAATSTYKALENATSVSDVYSKMANELGTASSIGTDTAAEVTNNNDGTFTIKKGTVEVADDLAFNLHVGADADMTNKINVNIETMNSANLGIKGLNVTDKSGIAATYAIDAINDAISKVSSQRSALGAVQNRLEHTIDNLDNISENTSSAESRIRDTDIAKEMVEYSKNNILSQAGQSMLAQAKSSNQGVLSLLQ